MVDNYISVYPTMIVLVFSTAYPELGVLDVPDITSCLKK